MSGSSATSEVTLPDRVTVLACMACGAMGRQERCASCSEHKLVLVAQAELEELRAAGAHAARLIEIARPLGDHPSDPVLALERLGDAARRALREPPPEPDEPETVTGWWCAECGNVDLPQPCIGVCVWRATEWVSLALYQRERRRIQPQLDAARRLRGLLSRAAAIRPRPGQAARNWQALARAAAAAPAGSPPRPTP
jgi:hypothetical protein